MIDMQHQPNDCDQVLLTLEQLVPLLLQLDEEVEEVKLAMG